MTRVLDPDDIARVLKRIAHEIIERNRGTDRLMVMGIHTRGVPLAVRIAEAMGEIEDGDVPVGTLDIGLHRDDLDARPTPELHATHLPVDLAGMTVVLVDDVLYTGRTIRAALDALTDLGRPSAVQLAVLADRGHRQLPIRADYVGKNLPTSEHERVTVQLDEIDGVEGVWIQGGAE